MVDSSKQNITWWEITAMQAINLEDIDRPDFVALDKEGQVLLIAEVKGFPFNFTDKKTKNYGVLRLIHYLQVAKKMIPFVMLVDTENILIFQLYGKKLSEPILCLSTANMLSHYEPEFTKKQRFSFYLTAMIQAWLRDLAYHWNTEIPLALKEMSEVGLLQLLENGTTQAY